MSALSLPVLLPSVLSSPISLHLTLIVAPIHLSGALYSVFGCQKAFASLRSTPSTPTVTSRLFCRELLGRMRTGVLAVCVDEVHVYSSTGS
jgi:hypothetical protein